jgi:hypothetical protein
MDGYFDALFAEPRAWRQAVIESRLALVPMHGGVLQTGSLAYVHMAVVRPQLGAIVAVWDRSRLCAVVGEVIAFDAPSASSKSVS